MLSESTGPDRSPRTFVARGDTRVTATVDFHDVAERCNADPRFQEMKWLESDVTVEEQMGSATFQTVLARLMPKNVQITVETTIAALYAHRAAKEAAARRVKTADGQVNANEPIAVGSPIKGTSDAISLAS